MRKWLICSVVLFLTLPGCMVGKGKYEAAVADMEAAKTELEKMRMHRDALEQQMNALKTSNEAVSTDLEMMTAEVQRIKEGRKGEQALVQNRNKEVARQQQQLVTKHKRLIKEFQKVKSQNKALKDTVVRYQKELKETREKKMASVSVPSRAKQSTGAMTSKAKPASSPGVNTASRVSGKHMDLVNINKASVNDLMRSLDLTKEVAEGVVANRPYRLRGELVAKHVVPKATFDVIKDRITAAR